MYHPPSYNTHTLKGPPTPTSYPQPQDVPSTILQHSYTKGTPHPPTPNHRMYHPPSYNTHTLKGPPYPQPQDVPSTILQHSYTKGTLHPHPYPQPQDVPSTILQHSYTKGTLHPHPQPQDVPSTILQHSYTKGTPQPPPPTPNHRMYHPPSYNTHILKGPSTPTPYPQPQVVPSTILQHSYTKGTPYPPPPTPNHRMYLPPSYNTHTLKLKGQD